MNDFWGNELNIGDIVAIEAKGYRMLVEATIISFTKLQVRVEYLNTWNFGKPGRKETYLVYPNQIIKKM